MNPIRHGFDFTSLSQASTAQVHSGALIVGGQERRTIVLCISWGIQGNESGQDSHFRSQAIQRPRTHGRSHKLGGTRMHLHLGLSVGRDVGVHAIEHTQTIRMACKVGKQFADWDPAVAMLLEFEGGTQQSAIAVATLTVEPRKLWLVIKRIDVRRRLP